MILWYLAAWLAGCIGSAAGLLVDHSNPDRPINKRVALLYFVCGTASSLAIVTIAHQTEGLSPMIVAMSIFAAFKAVDILTSGGLLIKEIIKRFSSK